MTIAEKYNWSESYTPFTVEELRELAAKHGMDIVFIIGYNKADNTFNRVSVGKTKEDSDRAAVLSTQIMQSLNPEGNPTVLEDRRNEHTN